jgi:hypothetical protein
VLQRYFVKINVAKGNPEEKKNYFGDVTSLMFIAFGLLFLFLSFYRNLSSSFLFLP